MFKFNKLLFGTCISGSAILHGMFAQRRSWQPLLTNTRGNDGSSLTGPDVNEFTLARTLQRNNTLNGMSAGFTLMMGTEFSLGPTLLLLQWTRAMSWVGRKLSMQVSRSTTETFTPPRLN